MPSYESPTGYKITATYGSAEFEFEISEITKDGEPIHTGDRVALATHDLELNGKTIFLDQAGGRWAFDQLIEIKD